MVPLRLWTSAPHRRGWSSVNRSGNVVAGGSSWWTKLFASLNVMADCCCSVASSCGTSIEWWRCRWSKTIHRFIVGALSVKGENVFCTIPRLCSSVCSSSFTTSNIATSTSRGHLNIPFSPGHIFWKLLLARFIFKLIPGLLTWKTFISSPALISAWERCSEGLSNVILSMLFALLQRMFYVAHKSIIKWPKQMSSFVTMKYMFVL